MKIGFAGLGQMGRPTAFNLLKSKAALTVADRSSKSFDEFESKGVRTTTDAAALADSDVIFLCLPNDKAVEGIIAGESGLLPKLREGQIVVDLSTITYKATVNINQMLAARGVRFVDAPISGMEARAVDGTLTVMCGGERADFDKVKPLLDCIGNKILYMGGPGSGQLRNLSTNSCSTSMPRRSPRYCQCRRKWGSIPTSLAKWSIAGPAAAMPRSSSYHGS